MGEKGKPLDKRGDTYQRDNLAIFVAVVIFLLGIYAAVAVWELNFTSFGAGIVVTCLAIICMRLVQWIWNMVKPPED